MISALCSFRENEDKRSQDGDTHDRRKDWSEFESELIDCDMSWYVCLPHPSLWLTAILSSQDAFLQVRTGMVMISDGKSKPELARLHLTMEVITLQRPEQVQSAISPTAAMLSNQLNQPPLESKERMVQITRQKEGGLGLSIKVGDCKVNPSVG